MFLLAEKMEPLIDSVPAQLTGSLVSRLSSYVPLGRFAMALGKDIPDMFKIMLAPASQILDQYFESSVRLFCCCFLRLLSLW